MKKSISSNNRLLISLGILITVMSISISCSKSSSMYNMGGGGGNPGGSGGPGVNEVWIMSASFNPSTITVAAGTTITWTNKGGTTHTVTSDAGLFDSGGINDGGNYPHTFSTAGTFKYHCSIHPFMTGTVIVN